jgi:phage tail-like protein
MASGDVARSRFAGLYRFEVDGVEIGTFQEVGGLRVEMKVEEVTEGGRNDFAHKLPGPISWPNIVLKRGVTNGDELFRWFNDTAAGVNAGAGFERLTGSVAALDEQRRQIRQWSFAGALPVKWTGPDFTASGSGIAVEELEIAHHGFTSGA